MFSCTGEQGEQPGGAAQRRGPGEDVGRQGQQEAGEEDQGVDDATRGRETSRRSIQGTK